MEFLPQEPHLRTEAQKEEQGGPGRLMRDGEWLEPLKDQQDLGRQKWDLDLEAERTRKARPVVEKPGCSWGTMKLPGS